MKKLSILLAVLYVITGSQVSAKSNNYVFTGKDMYESCNHAITGLDKTGEYDDHRFGVCAGYVAGIVDFHTVSTTVESLSGDMFCLPRNIKTAQVIRKVAQYLEDNPGKHHDLAAYIVILALRKAWPCPEAVPQ